MQITPDTGDSHWGGESLDYDWVLRRLFEIDEMARLEAAREAAQERGDYDEDRQE